MNLKEIKAILNQKGIPQNIQNEVYTKASNFLKEEMDVDVVVSVRTVRVDVYGQDGVKEDTFIYKIPSKIKNFDDNNLLDGVDVCGLS